MRKAGKRRAGRPRVIASFYAPLSKIMADMTPLPAALRILGLNLDKRQIRALYRSREFREMYQAERTEYLQEWPRVRLRRQGPKGGRLGLSLELLRGL